MNKKFNRKKLFSIKKNFFYTLFFFFSIIIIVIYTYKNFLKIENLLISTVENLSFDFNYTLQYYDIDGLNKIKEADIIIIIKPYMNTSIFLLPLNNISNPILENNWVKTLKLKTDYNKKVFESSFYTIQIFYGDLKEADSILKFFTTIFFDFSITDISIGFEIILLKYFFDNLKKSRSLVEYLIELYD